jgi:SAM-dependent methyltransferase
MNIDLNGFERHCPICGPGPASIPFASHRIDPNKITGFTYASRKIPEFMSLRMVRCLGCDTVYAPVAPPPDFLERAYSEAGYDSSDEAGCAAITYAKALRRSLERLSLREGALEIGAGNGAFLPLLRGMGFSNVIGIEPSLAAIRAAKQEARPMLRQGIFNPSDFNGQYFSLICSFQTLEHLYNPTAIVSAALDMLIPGGMVAVVTHDHSALLNRILGRFSPIIDVEHLQLFSVRSLRKLIELYGFEDIGIIPLKNAYPIRYWLRLLPLPLPIKKKVISLMEAMGFGKTVLHVNVGNILAIARKPFS